MKIGDVVQSIENPSIYGTVQYSSFGVSIHYWTYENGNRILTKTLGADPSDVEKFWKVTKLPAWGRIDEYGCVVHDWDSCPICGSELVREAYYMDGHILCEEYARCDAHKCYFFEYSYGNYAQYVGDKEWFWSYSTEDKDRKRISDEIKAEIIVQREVFQGESKEIGTTG